MTGVTDAGWRTGLQDARGHREEGTSEGRASAHWAPPWPPRQPPQQGHLLLTHPELRLLRGKAASPPKCIRLETTLGFHPGQGTPEPSRFLPPGEAVPTWKPQRLPRASRLLTQGGFRVWVAGLKCCSQSPTQRQPRCGQGPGDGTFKSPPDSSPPPPAPFAGRVSRGLTFRLSQRTWFQVQEAQGDWSPGDRDISASPGPGPQSPWGFRSGSGSVLPRRARCRAVCGAVPGWPTTVFLFLLIPPHPRVGH